MDAPQKHGCLVAWLYLVIIGGIFGLIGIMFLSQPLPARPGYHPPSSLTLILAAVCLVASIICAGGLFFLKRWAFYGYILANAVLVWVNFNDRAPVGRVLSPLFWTICLVGVMQIGGRYKGWGRLR